MYCYNAQYQEICLIFITTHTPIWLHINFQALILWKHTVGEQIEILNTPKVYSRSRKPRKRQFHFRLVSIRSVVVGVIEKEKKNSELCELCVGEYRRRGGKRCGL
jgi:hypothetical protein